MQLPTFEGQVSPAAVGPAIAEHGGVVLRGVVPAALLELAAAEFDALYPQWDEYVAQFAAAGGDPDVLRPDSDELQAAGPFGTPGLDGVPLLPLVRAVATELLGPTAVLAQSHLWAKYGQLAGEYDLPLHSDFSNHTVVYPSDDPRFQVLHGIAYYTDVGLGDGPTYVVSQTVSRGEAVVPWDRLRDAEAAAHLHDHETPVVGPPGTILLYTTKLLHRASVMRDGAARRMTHFFSYAPWDVPWLGWGRWLCSVPGTARQDFIEACRPDELVRVGFPSPSSDYWSPETIAGTSLMYPGLALDDYLETGRG